MNLKERAKTFLEKKPPDEINYVPDSIAEMFIRNYAHGKKFDDELMELGELAMMSAEEAVDSHSTKEAKEYFTECRNILSDILDEL